MKRPFLVGLVVFAAHAGALAGTQSYPLTAPELAPTNDECTGAIVVPAVPDGGTTILTDPVDIGQATPQDVDEGLHPCADGGADRTIWYSFTPSITGQYVISACGTTAAGNTVYDNVLSVFDSTGGACPPAGIAIACDDSYPCETHPSDAPYVDQGTIMTRLVAGHTYFVVAGHWAPDLGGVSGTHRTMVVSFQFLPKPRNDDCRVTGGGYAAGGEGPAPLALDKITHGTTAFATNDYRSTGCPFLPPGELPTTADGADAVFSFVPPGSGSYSFRYVQDDSAAPLRAQSPVLYISTQCPDPNASAGVPGCFAAVNRMDDQATGNSNRSEELDCIPLTGGTTYFVYFDDAFAGNVGGDLAMEVTTCHRETEPNDGVATATPWSPNSGSFMEGAVTPSGTSANGGDVDFYALGAPPAGSKLFAAIDSAAAHDSDFEMRFTSLTDTLAYDDNDGTTIIGSNAPVIAGPIAPGGSVYARVNGKPTLAGSGPYRLYFKAESGPPELEPDPDLTPDGGTSFYGWMLYASHVTQGGFVGGTILSWPLVGAYDIDCWRFVAHEGDQLLFFSDNNPSRSTGNITNVWPVLFSATGDSPAGRLIIGQIVRNLHPGTPQTGTLEGTEASGAPSVTSEFLPYRARYTGWYGVCLAPTGNPSGIDDPPASAYPLPYQASISINGGAVPPPQPADVAVTQAGPSGVVNAGDIFDYTITITNNDPSAIAQDLRIVDHLPQQLIVLSITLDDGFATGNTTCLALPTDGGNDAPIDCTVLALAPQATATYTITVQVPNCIAPGQLLHNDVTLTSYTQDANTANNAASSEFTTGYTGACTAIFCDVSGCAACDACRVDGVCTGIGGTCQTSERNCDDGDACTADTCNSYNRAHPCVNDSSELGDACDDGNPCTSDSCDPIQFCIFGPEPPGTDCDDFFGCTIGDVCDGNGSCFGHSVCDDGLPCTDDVGDEGNNCACSNTLSFAGTPCDDGNACTSETYCDGTGPTAAACTGGTPTDCDDGDCCTLDACDAGTGCTHAANPAVPVFTLQPSLGACAVLWPPEHGYADFTVAQTGATAASACGIASLHWASCTSSQVENSSGTGDGNATRDCVYSADTLSTRAERDGACSPTGRTYTARLMAVDVCGRTILSDPLEIGVWHDRGNPPASTNIYPVVPGSDTTDTRAGNNGAYPATASCGSGSACTNGTIPDRSDADPEAEIRQLAAVSVDSLRVDKVGANLQLSWTAPVASVPITRYHVWRRDPVTLTWTLVAELNNTATSYAEAIAGPSAHYKVTAVIK